jgi:WD40 repeat protein
MAEPVFRIFVSSPGDVSEERALAERVIARLAGEWTPAIPIEPFLWEHEPLRATGTYQDQIDRVCRPSDADVVVCLLWCRFGTRLPANIARPDGTTYASGTAYELEDAVAGYERTGTRPALLVYKKTAKLLVDIEDPRYIDRKRQKDDLEAFLRGWAENPDGTAKRAVHRFETAADFEDFLERHLAKLIAARAETLGQKPKRAVSWRESPFRGLAVFEPEHAPIFFGRTAATSAVLAALRARDARGEGFVTVVGASGSGKSSVVRAGVLPLLTTAGVMAHVGLWRRAVVVPGERHAGLFDGLAAAVIASEALPELVAGGATAASLAATFREAPAAFAAVIEGALREAAVACQRDRSLQDVPAARLALVVDQMEQLFTLEGVTADARRTFVQCLAAAVRARRVMVIATLRSDFFQRCQEIPELVALMQGDGQYQLQNPGPAELERIITRPAALAGFDFEPGSETVLSLELRLRDAALEYPQSLPLLEFALEQLYERRTPDGRLTHAAYDAIGELRGAVAHHAEEAFLAWAQSRGSTPGSRRTDADAALGILLRSLVTVRTDAELVTARRIEETEIPAGLPRDLANALLEARLLVKDTDQAGRPVFTVAHEAVLREWPRARSAVAQSLEFLRIRARITADRLRWEDSSPHIKQRDQGFLLPEGRRLAEAEELLRKYRSDLEPRTVDFIAASLARATQAKRWRWSRYAASVVLLIGAAFGLYAFMQSRQIEQQRRLAVAYRLASQAELTRTSQPGLSALLAVESLARQPGVEGDIALRRSLMLLPELVSDREVSQIEAVSSAPGTEVVEYRRDEGLRVVNLATNVASGWMLKSVATADDLVLSSTHVTADGRRLINLTQSPSPKNRLRVVNTATGVVEGEAEVDAYGERAALSPNGRYLAAFTSAGIRTWDVEASPPREYRRAVKWSGNKVRTAFSPDSRRLAAVVLGSVYVFDPTLASEPRIISMRGFFGDVAFRPGRSDELAIAAGNEVCLWPLASTAPASCLPLDQSTNHLAFSQDGSTLAIAGESGVVRVVDMATRSQKARFVSDEALSSVLWSGSGSMVAGLTPKGIVHVWRVDDEREVARLSDEKQVLSFDRSGTLATVTSGSRVRRWALHNGAAERRLLSHPQEVHDLTFTPDGKSIVTGSGYAGEEGSSAPDYSVRVWSLTDAAEPLVLPQSQAVGAVRVLPGGRYLIVAGWRRITLWDLQERKETASIPCESAFEEIELTFLSFAWSRDGRFLACHTAPETIQVFRLPDGQPVGQALTGDGPALALAFDDGGKYLAMGRGKTIDLWDTAAAGVVVRVPGDAEEFLLTFIPRSLRLAVIGEKGVRIYDAERRAFEDVRIDQAVTAGLIRFSPDGRSVVLANEGVLSVRDLATGRQLARLTLPAEVRAMAFSPNGAFLATASGDNVARIWEIATGRERVRLTDISKTGADSLLQIAFSEDGRLLATAHRWDVRLWAWRPEDLIAQACRQVRGNLSAAEWVEYVGTGDRCAATCSAFPACTPASADAQGGGPRLLK